MWSRAPGARPADQPGSAPGQEASGLMACLSALSQRAPPAPPVPGEAAHGKLCGLEAIPLGCGLVSYGETFSP
jgi:hypothetical protein